MTIMVGMTANKRRKGRTSFAVISVHWSTIVPNNNNLGFQKFQRCNYGDSYYSFIVNSFKLYLQVKLFTLLAKV